MNRRKTVRHLRTNREGAITPMRIAHDKNFVRVYVAAKKKLPDQIGDERIDVNIVKAIPRVMRCTQCQIKIASCLRMSFVIPLHDAPLAVVYFLGRPAPTVHRYEERPAIGRARTYRPHRVATEILSELNLLAIVIL